MDGRDGEAHEAREPPAGEEGAATVPVPTEGTELNPPAGSAGSAGVQQDGVSAERRNENEDKKLPQAARGLPSNARLPAAMQRHLEARAAKTPEQVAREQRMRTKALHKQISVALVRVVAPVVLCMGLSIYLVHSQGSGDCRREESLPARSYTPPDLDQFISSDVFPPVPSPPQDPEDTTRLVSIILLSSFAAAIVVMTFVLVLLYKYHCEWILFLWLVIAVIIVLGYEGGLYLYEWARSICYPIDWITLALLAWNFALGGMCAIFWKSTRIIQQAFLIVLSGLLAWVFTTWEVWASWVLLGILVVWDLIAVLTPCGPLQMLIKAAKERGDPIPALVYDTNPEDVGRDHEAKSMLSVIQFRKKKRPTNEDSGDEAAGDAAADSGVSAAGAVGMCVEVGNIDISPSAEPPVTHEMADETVPQAASQSASAPTGDVMSPTATTMTSTTDLTNTASGVQSPVAASPRQRWEEKPEIAKTPAAAVNGEQIGFLGAHLKLGLGDFVFYSLLVATASRDSEAGVMTTIASFVAILAGLCLTLFLLVMFRKPLPALPISICFGILFNFTTKYTLTPFLGNLFPELLSTAV
ncbi:Presenilin-1 [Porphyridium purpureum]|uniref:Presenilin-1 n=1 Tax=Porphyridium purpureum TaxID=35688 RepID=A0A5J4YVD2_PORPP|nr:Presenilin-1 [Porphyridium purpureum]|eukprot:POR5294..scf227_4